MTPTNVTIVEVGPRDGLQNEALFIPTDIKVEFIHLLAQSGLPYIEATSFVSPEKIPQLADNQDVIRQITRKPGVHYPVLVPNLVGMNNAIDVGVKTIAVFGAVSETFSQKNINCSIEESIARFTRVINKAKEHDIRVRGYISCCWGCPYEGKINADAVIQMAKTLLELGCYEISLGDTIGVATPKQVSNLLEQLSQELPIDKLAGHFHNTYGQAIANIYAALQCGVSVFDSSVSGLGGCPYAEGATGNVATEDVLYLMHGLDIETGVDLQKCLAAGAYINDYLKREPDSKIARLNTLNKNFV